MHLTHKLLMVGLESELLHLKYITCTWLNYHSNITDFHFFIIIYTKMKHNSYNICNFCQEFYIF